MATAPGPIWQLGTLVVPGGDGVLVAHDDAALVGWVRASAVRAQRVASVCRGAFVLAAAGLFTCRAATTPWASAQQLQDDYPEIDVQLDLIHLREGKVWTSAGMTAGLDLALAIVEEDLGADVAQTVARWLVMFARRPGGQSQFATGLGAAPRDPPCAPPRT